MESSANITPVACFASFFYEGYLLFDVLEPLLLKIPRFSIIIGSSLFLLDSNYAFEVI